MHVWKIYITIVFVSLKEFISDMILSFKVTTQLWKWGTKNWNQEQMCPTPPLLSLFYWRNFVSRDKGTVSKYGLARGPLLLLLSLRMSLYGSEEKVAPVGFNGNPCLTQGDFYATWKEGCVQHAQKLTYKENVCRVQRTDVTGGRVKWDWTV